MPKRRKQKPEKDSIYFLKILLYFIVGAIWLKPGTAELFPGVRAIPIGFFIGLVFAAHDHFAIDRKIEYAILLAAAVLSFVAPLGLVIQL